MCDILTHNYVVNYIQHSLSNKYCDISVRMKQMEKELAELRKCVRKDVEENKVATKGAEKLPGVPSLMTSDAKPNKTGTCTNY